jgi:hypothetical protein
VTQTTWGRLSLFGSPENYVRFLGIRNVAVHWLVPPPLRSRQLRFCVVATDPAGTEARLHAPLRVT